MIICLCNRINERAIDKAIADGAKTPISVQKQNGCRFNCGACRRMIGERIAAATNSAISAHALTN